MINLLPPTEKQKLSREKTKKIVIILGALILVFLICLILILISIEIYIQSQVSYQKILYESKEKQFKDSQAQEIQKEISEYNQNLLEIKSFYQKQANLVEILEKITQTLPEGVCLNSFSYQKARISISGYAPTRDILFEFKENLEQGDDFKEVFFPSSNWVKAIDIDFSLSFTINYENEQE